MIRNTTVCRATVRVRTLLLDTVAARQRRNYQSRYARVCVLYERVLRNFVRPNIIFALPPPDAPDSLSAYLPTPHARAAGSQNEIACSSI